MKLSDVANSDFGVLCAVTFFLAETFAALLLISNHFIALHMIKDLCLDFNTAVAEGQVAIRISHNNVREFHFGAGFTTDFGNVQCLVFFNLELLAGYFYDCEHNGSKIRWAKVRVKVYVANSFPGRRARFSGGGSILGSS